MYPPKFEDSNPSDTRATAQNVQGESSDDHSTQAMSIDKPSDEPPKKINKGDMYGIFNGLVQGKIYRKTPY